MSPILLHLVNAKVNPLNIRWITLQLRESTDGLDVVKGSISSQAKNEAGIRTDTLLCIPEIGQNLPMPVAAHVPHSGLPKEAVFAQRLSARRNYFLRSTPDAATGIPQAYSPRGTILLVFRLAGAAPRWIIFGKRLSAISAPSLFCKREPVDVPLFSAVDAGLRCATFATRLSAPAAEDSVQASLMRNIRHDNSFSGCLVDRLGFNEALDGFRRSPLGPDSKKCPWPGMT